MKGYLLAEKTVTPGDGSFFDCPSQENDYRVFFEDDRECGYFYATTIENGELRVLDSLYIYDTDNIDSSQPLAMKIIWSKDWLKCALIVNAQCHAIFDFDKRRGYSLVEFPPPSTYWTTGDRHLTQELIEEIFG